MEGSIATIKVHGTLAKRMNMMMALSGGASYEMLIKSFKAALADEQVKGIFLDVDSPGGSVDGLLDWANVIYESRGQKPVVAFADGMMASAAYISSSAADYVFSANDTTQVGSVGVIAVHGDYSRAYDQRGITPTVFSSGKYKAIGNKFEPLTKEGKEYIQAELDYIYTVVVNDVARNRGVTAQMANTEMAEGRIFVGAQAWDAGLADELLNRDQAIERLKEIAGP